MRFQVPQFIEIEDTIFGPLTFKQFVYVVGGVGISYVLYRVLPLFVAIFFIIPVLSLAGALAFYQINGKPFIHILEAAFRYVSKKNFYLWQKSKAKAQPQEKEKDVRGVYNPITVPRLSESRLKDISWSLEIERGGAGKKDNT